MLFLIYPATGLLVLALRAMVVLAGVVMVMFLLALGQRRYDRPLPGIRITSPIGRIEGGKHRGSPDERQLAQSHR